MVAFPQKHGTKRREGPYSGQNSRRNLKRGGRADQGYELPPETVTEGSSIPQNPGYRNAREEPMTRMSIREVVESWRLRYLRASRNEKGRILEEFVALTGYHRKSAIRLLRHRYRPKHLDRRGRPRQYTPDVKAAFLLVWEACGRISPKRLAPFLPEIVAVLKRHGELRIRPETERLLLRISRPPSIGCFLPTAQSPCEGTRPPSPGPSLGTRSPCGPSRTGTKVNLGFWRWMLCHFWETTKGEYLHTLKALHIPRSCRGCRPRTRGAPRPRAAPAQPTHPQAPGLRLPKGSCAYSPHLYPQSTPWRVS